MKILVTGASGLLGWNIAQAAQDNFDVLGTYLKNQPPLQNAARLDLSANHAIRNIFKEFSPHTLVHCAAMTHADQCEKEPALARQLNTQASLQLAQMCEKTGTRMIYISTDLVFDGKKGGYSEGDEPSPLGYYGETKLAAETEVAHTLENHVILRVSLMYGRSLSGRRGADEGIIAAQHDGRVLHLFTDEYRSPIAVPALVRIILKLADDETKGLYHCGGGERLSRFEFAQRLNEFVALDMDKIIPSYIADVSTIPPRAPDVSLDSARLIQQTGIAPPDIRAGLSLLHKTK